MPDSRPPPGKFYVSGYDAGDKSYPIVSVLKIAYGSRGYDPPAMLSLCPDTAFAAHKLVMVKEASEDKWAEWVYLLLPGPYVPDTRYDLLLGPIQIKRRVIQNTNQAPTLTATVKTTYSAWNDTDSAAWELVETNSDGTGSAGNPVYPTVGDDFWDDERSDVHQTTQLVTDLTTHGSLVVSSGTATEIRYEGYNQFLRKKIIETWPVPATARVFNIVGRRGFVGSLSRNRLTVGSTPTTQSATVDVDRTPEGKDRVREDAITYSSGSPLARKNFNRFGGLDVEIDTFVAASTTPTNVTYSVQKLIQDKELQARLIETVIATGSAITTVDNVDKSIPGSRATVALTLVLNSDSHPADTATEVYERLEFPDNPLMKIQRKTTYSIPATFTESVDHGMAYPTLFNSYYSDDIEGTTIDSRGGFSVVVPHLVTNSFGTTRVDVSPYQIIENDEVIFSARISGLMNSGTLTKVINGTTYTRPIPASIPTKTTYVGLIGTYITVGGGSNIWRAGIFETQTITVKLQ